MRPSTRSFVGSFVCTLPCFCCILFNVIFIESCTPSIASHRVAVDLVSSLCSAFCTFLHLLVSLAHCANVFCAILATAVAAVAAVAVGVCCFRFVDMYLFLRYYCRYRAAAATSRSPGESFCINCANNQLCYIFVHFISFYSVCFCHCYCLCFCFCLLPKGHFQSRPTFALLFVTVLMPVLVLVWFLLLNLVSFLFSGGFLCFYFSGYLPACVVCLRPQVCLCLCVCV